MSKLSQTHHVKTLAFSTYHFILTATVNAVLFYCAGCSGLRYLLLYRGGTLQGNCAVFVNPFHK